MRPLTDTLSVPLRQACPPLLLFSEAVPQASRAPCPPPVRPPALGLAPTGPSQGLRSHGPGLEPVSFLGKRGDPKLHGLRGRWHARGGDRGRVPWVGGPRASPVPVVRPLTAPRLQAFGLVAGAGVGLLVDAAVLGGGPRREEFLRDLGVSPGRPQHGQRAPRPEGVSVQLPQSCPPNWLGQHPLGPPAHREGSRSSGCGAASAPRARALPT